MGMMIAPGLFAGDPLFGSVILLTYGEGADANTTFTDHSSVARALTANGDVQHDTGRDVHGQSILFDGTGDYISAADATDIRLDAADFCFECYAYLTSLAHTATLLSKLTAGNTGYRFFVTTGGKLTLNFLQAGALKLNVVSVNSVPQNQIVHLAVSRAGTDGHVFIDGVLEATASQLAVPTTGNNAVMGLGFDIRAGSSGLQGSLNWCRLTYGNARYTADFTPPATPLSGS